MELQYLQNVSNRKMPQLTIFFICYNGTVAYEEKGITLFMKKQFL